MRLNLKHLTMYPYVSELFLEGKISIAKLSGRPDKFRNTCSHIERKNQRDKVIDEPYQVKEIEVIKH